MAVSMGVNWALTLALALLEGRAEWVCQAIVGDKDWEIYELLLRVTVGGLEVPAGSYIDSIQGEVELMRQLDRRCLVWLLEVHGIGPGERYFVNLSGASLGDPGFVGFVAEQLALTGINAWQLCFELTEQVAADADRAEEVVQGLRALGCLIAIDDVGAGLCNWARLSRLPFDYAKLDGALCQRVEQPRAQTVLRHLVGCLQEMGSLVVAEWVETPQQQDLLTGLGVSLMQGYGVGRAGRCQHRLA